jgi:SAM-dependent methyltransferase
MAGGTAEESRGYYETEASQLSRRALGARREELRVGFVDQLRAEHRNSVLDVGAGPGLDGRGFGGAGLFAVGVDLALGNCRLAVAVGTRSVQGSAVALPIRAGSFHAGWSMSTLMHLDDDDAATASRQLAEAVEPGGPCMVGLWGGGDIESVDQTSIEGQERRFFRRTLDHAISLLSDAWILVDHEVWELGPDMWPYQVFSLRAPNR